MSRNVRWSFGLKPSEGSPGPLVLRFGILWGFLVGPPVRISSPVDIILAVDGLPHRIGDVLEAEFLYVAINKKEMPFSVVARGKIFGIGFRTAVKPTL